MFDNVKIFQNTCNICVSNTCTILNKTFYDVINSLCPSILLFALNPFFSVVPLTRNRRPKWSINVYQWAFYINWIKMYLSSQGCFLPSHLKPLNS